MIDAKTDQRAHPAGRVARIGIAGCRERENRRGVARFQADPKAVAELADDADPTGMVTIPTVTMHAIDDPQVPVEVDAMA